MMFHSQRLNGGPNIAYTMTKYERTHIRTLPHFMMMVMVIAVVMFDAGVIHAFIPSSSTLHQQHHHPIANFQSISARGVTTTSDNEKADRPLDLSATTTTTTNHDESLSMNQIINLTNKDISQMSFRELQRHVRTLMMNDHATIDHTKKAEEITRGMTTSILREKIRSLSNLCIIRDDGVEDCSYDDEQVNDGMTTNEYLFYFFSDCQNSFFAVILTLPLCFH